MFFKHCFSVIFGEDVAFGGVFRCTVGLRDKYGKLISLYRNSIPVVTLFRDLETIKYIFYIIVIFLLYEWVSFSIP